jgi:hypothetical protein
MMPKSGLCKGINVHNMLKVFIALITMSYTAHINFYAQL